MGYGLAKLRTGMCIGEDEVEGSLHYSDEYDMISWYPDPKGGGGRKWKGGDLTPRDPRSEPISQYRGLP